VKVDDNTVDIVTKVPSATLPIQVTAIPIVPVKGSATLGNNPIGTGPYKFDEWNRGRYIAVKRHDGYWGPNKGKIAEYRVRVIPDNQTALAALQTGEVDLVLDLLPEQRALAPKYASVGSSEFSYGAFNTYKKELSDKRVRVAINMAIDRNKLVQTIFQGQAKPNDSQHLTEGMLGYNDKLGPYPYDLDKAKALMKAAGYEYGMNLTINVPIGRYLKAEETAEFIASSLAKININAEVKRLDFDTFRSVGRIKGTAAGAMDIKLAWNSNEFADGSRSNPCTSSTCSESDMATRNGGMAIGKVNSRSDSNDGRYRLRHRAIRSTCTFRLSVGLGWVNTQGSAFSSNSSSDHTSRSVSRESSTLRRDGATPRGTTVDAASCGVTLVT